MVMEGVARETQYVIDASSLPCIHLAAVLQAQPLDCNHVPVNHSATDNSNLPHLSSSEQFICYLLGTNAYFHSSVYSLHPLVLRLGHLRPHVQLQKSILQWWSI